MLKSVIGRPVNFASLILAQMNISQFLLSRITNFSHELNKISPYPGLLIQKTPANDSVEEDLMCSYYIVKVLSFFHFCQQFIPGTLQNLCNIKHNTVRIGFRKNYSSLYFFCCKYMYLFNTFTYSAMQAILVTSKLM